MDLSYSNTCTTIYSRRKTLLGKLAYGTLKSVAEAHFSEKKENKIQNNLIFLDKKISKQSERPGYRLAQLMWDISCTDISK